MRKVIKNLNSSVLERMIDPEEISDQFLIVSC